MWIMNRKAVDILIVATRQAGAMLLLASIVGLSFSAVSGQGIFGGSSNVNDGEKIEHITYDKAVTYLQEGNAIFIDARHGYDFHLGHIPGAINIPLGDLESLQPLIETLPRSETIITYCDGQECNSSELLARALTNEGFVHVKVFFAGWNEWLQHHHNDPLPQ